MWQEWITNYWVWLALGLVLIIIEIFVLPTTWFLWFGLSAILTGGLVGLFPNLGWEWVLLFYSVVSISAAVIGRRYFRHDRDTDEVTQSHLNQRTQRYIGREVEVVQAISNGVGRAKLGDTTWRVQGADATVGSRLRVVDVNGASLVVSNEANTEV